MEEKTMLSQGEWRIMNLLWEKKNRTIMEMVEDFAGVTDWDKHTLIVMLKRMEAKGVVAYETVGRAKHYYPVEKQADFVQQETKSFLDRVYRGSFGEMLTTMVKQEQLKQLKMEYIQIVNISCHL